jgi:hypothetical protein
MESSVMARLREEDGEFESNGLISFSGKVFRRPLFLIGSPHKAINQSKNWGD